MLVGMVSRKPHVVIFFGGESHNQDLSNATGYWACHFVPRDRYDVTPVHIRHDGTWQVPLGSLPRQGPIARMLKGLFSSLRAVTPADGLARLLRRPASAFMSVIRGRGGDDGAIASLGASLNIPVIGSSARTSLQAYDKRLFAQRVHDIATIPRVLDFLPRQSVDDMVTATRNALVPPLFVKPTALEGSVGVERVASLDELTAAVQRARSMGEVMVQAQARGTELSLTLLNDERGRLQVLPPTLIVPRLTTYYDHLAKRQPGRVTLHTPQENNRLLQEAVEIARNVYERLGCRGYASIDMVADDTSIDVLEINTILTASGTTPLQQQLKVAGIHPSFVLDRLIRQAIG